MKTRIYEMTCPGCGKKTRYETMLGVPGGDYEDYPLKHVGFECENCGRKFTVSLNPDMPELRVSWEAGEDVE